MSIDPDGTALPHSHTCNDGDARHIQVNYWYILYESINLPVHPLARLGTFPANVYKTV